jgi:hypothetical protein
MNPITPLLSWAPHNLHSTTTHGPFEILGDDGLFRSTVREPASVFNPHHFSTTLVRVEKDSPRRKPRPTAPRIKQQSWTEAEDSALFLSPNGRLPNKHATACTRRLKYLKAEEAYRIDHHEDFKYFSKLPLELQIKIWKIAAWEPRVVELHSTSLLVNYTPTPLEDKETGSDSPLFHGLPPLRALAFRSQTLNPPLLSTCTESRRIALRRNYTRSHLQHNLVPDPPFFDLLCDTMFISSKNMWRWFMSGHMGKSERKTNYPYRFPFDDAGVDLRTNLRSLALDAGFFLGKPCKNDDGSVSFFPIYEIAGYYRSLVINLLKR